VVDREMQVAAVVKWVCGKQCGAVVNALKGGQVLSLRGRHPQAASRHNHGQGRSSSEIAFEL
jgi:hypothetical protein